MDTAEHGVGKIDKVTSPNGAVQTTTYDSLSRPISAELTLAGDSFAMGFDYDDASRVSTITYPPDNGAPFVVKNTYDRYGNLRKVDDATTHDSYWTLTDTDSAGRITGEQLGQHLTTTRGYDDARNRVKSIVTTNDASTLLQNVSYGYDDKQNLAWRADARQGRTESFRYDELDRLACASLDNFSSCQQTYDYELNGNIKSSSSAGVYAYDPNHPHAVQTVGPDTYGYDVTGNQTQRPDAAVIYTAFDMPKTFMLAKGGMVTLEYDGTQARVRKTTADAVTVYLGGLYERVTHPSTGLVEHHYYV